MKKHRVRISEKNRKMGGIPSVSLPPVVACGKNIPCARDCYVVRNMLRGPYGRAIRDSYRANLAALKADRVDFFDQIAAYLERRRPQYFRFHVSGDWLDRDHVQRALDLARSFAEVRFLAFTKRHDLLPPVSRLPVNFSMIASLWPGWGRRPRGYRAAFLRDPALRDRRIPSDAIECPGGCDSCGMCWALPALGRDVVFERH